MGDFVKESNTRIICCCADINNIPVFYICIRRKRMHGIFWWQVHWLHETDKKIYTLHFLENTSVSELFHRVKNNESTYHQLLTISRVAGNLPETPDYQASRDFHITPEKMTSGSGNFLMHFKQYFNQIIYVCIRYFSVQMTGRKLCGWFPDNSGVMKSLW